MKGSFATFVRGLMDRAIPLAFPFFVLEKGPQRSTEEVEAIRQLSRERYAEPLEQAGEAGDASEAESSPDQDLDDDLASSDTASEKDGTESTPAW